MDGARHVLKSIMRMVRVLVTLVILMAIAVFSAPAWLPVLGKALIRQDPLAPADLIVVLSGSVPDRPRYGAELFHEGLAPRILCASSLVPQFLIYLEKPMTHAELSAAALRDANVPDEAIIVRNRSTSTYGELKLVRDMMREKGWTRVILVSSPTHLRRIRLTWDHLTEERGPEAILRATPYSDFNPDAWWRNERDLISVQNEYVKILYYVLYLFRGHAPVASD